jgi:phage terminase large subunit
MDLLLKALRTPHGRFAYVAPYYNQAKTVAWDVIKEFARPVLASAPNEAELRVDLLGGSRISLYGGDNGDRLRGLGLDGVVLDEYADIPHRCSLKS